MALDSNCINNVNEFYSHHYLDALLEGDLKGILTRWNQAEEEDNRTPPYKKLSRCSEDFFRAKARATTTATAEDRFTETHPINVRLAEALGYEYMSGEYELIEDNLAVPVLASLQRDGNPYLWLVEAPWADEVYEPFQQRLVEEQRSKSGAFRDGHKFPHEPWQDLFSLIFRRESPPRWVILLAGSLIFLVERHKWGQGKYLLFNVDELLGTKADCLKSTAAFLSKDTLCPDDGTVLHDTLDDNSHKHAFAVSGDLKYGLRYAVELLANEYVFYQRTVAKQSLFGDDDLARKLTVESLTYLYRLLFLFYAEARGEQVGVLPMKSDEYRNGYSLESLRDLEQVPLTTETAQNTYFIDLSLRMLFKLVNEGFNPQQRQIVFTEAQELYLDHGFIINGLESPLFDTKRTPLLSSVKFRNVVLQEVIQLLSLSREGGGHGKKKNVRGRISYAELGINQLGAVYEGLLSYSGFFAQEPLYEVKTAGAAATDETQQSYFVPESEIAKYHEDEFVSEEIHGGEKGERRRKKYDKGTFIFRLAGRDRQKSASYYTPECLTQCVVKYALKELLKDKKADEILTLTICEPAMGSGAFLNEAVNQLADAYLERKQKETSQSISPGDYPEERQKAKAYLATHNCYGVDLNPIAVELAKVSLWLNTIYKDSRCPWFGLRLAVGNSLIGARRQVFKAADLKRKNAKDEPNWLGLVPEHVPLGPTWHDRPKNTVYHFLVPDLGMAAFDSDKVIKGLAPVEVKAIKEWRKDFCKPFDKAEVAKLIELSDAVDDLWKQVISERRRAVEKTNQPIPVWGQVPPPEQTSNIPAQEKIVAELERYYTAYRRLKLAMDYWCALWFWPIPEAAKLPSRDVFLFDLELILKGTIQTPQPAAVLGQLFPGEPVNPEHAAFVGHFGMVNVEELLKKNERLRIVDQVASRIRFHHWELRFADVFAEQGGFHLILGNPPWVLVSFDEAGVLADRVPIVALRDMSATQVAQIRDSLLGDSNICSAYIAEFETQSGSKAVLASNANYSLLSGMKVNYYKCFIIKSWEIASSKGVVGLLHPEGVYDDSAGGGLRAAIYSRLAYHFQFRNELPLFREIQHTRQFGLSIYRGESKQTIAFNNMAGIFHPSSIDASFAHDGHGSTPGIKDEKDNWDLRPHLHRLVRIEENSLKLFAQLYDSVGTPFLQARLPVIHSIEILSVLNRLAAEGTRLSGLSGEWFSSFMFDENGAQQDGTIRRKTRYPACVSDWIVSGPHFFIASPFRKCPNEGCSTHLDYNTIDLTSIPVDYLPRTNYVSACSTDEWKLRVGTWHGKLHTEYYRHIHRKMLSLTGERALVAAILPPGASHINAGMSVGFRREADLLLFSALCASLPIDFFVKTMGRTNLHHEIELVPMPTPSRRHRELLFARLLRLNCVTSHYSQLWENNFDPAFSVDYLVAVDPRLGTWGSLTACWDNKVPLRTDLERRHALVEIDALSAIALGLSEEELITIYRVQFPVLQQFERANLYDQVGRLVPADVVKSAERLGLDTHQMLNVSTFPSSPELIGQVETPGLGVTGGIVWEDPKMEPRMKRVYPPPFTKCDREADMRQAYREFQKRIATEESAP